MKTAGILTIAGMLLALAASGAQAQTLTGQVMAVKITECGARAVVCEGEVTLARDGARQVVHVTRHTSIVRAGKPVALPEVGLGNFVAITRAEAAVPASAGARPDDELTYAWPQQSP